LPASTALAWLRAAIRIQMAYSTASYAYPSTHAFRSALVPGSFSAWPLAGS
jgi:hypothetical protein